MSFFFYFYFQLLINFKKKFINLRQFFFIKFIDVFLFFLQKNEKLIMFEKVLFQNPDIKKN